MTYEPSSSGLRVNVGPVTTGRGLPYSVPVHLKAKPAVLSSELRLVAVAVRMTVVPSLTPPAGAPLMATVGDVPFDLVVKVACAMPPLPSSALMRMVWLGPSSAAVPAHVQLPDVDGV